jgi:RecB family nuclease, putative, TM0106 family
MHASGGIVLYSAKDLIAFLGCSHSTALDIKQLTKPEGVFTEDPYLELLQAKGIDHERAYLSKLQADGLSIIEIESSGSIEGKVVRTRSAMGSGPDVIYQGALFGAPWHGYSDFLIRKDGLRSKFGEYAYEVLDTKLSRSAKPKHVVQLCVYSKLVADEQGSSPHDMHIVLGDGSQVSLRVNDFSHYCDIARDRFDKFVDLAERVTVAEPCAHCGFCRWNQQCTDVWDKADHLSLVAGISRAQRMKLSA